MSITIPGETRGVNRFTRRFLHSRVGLRPAELGLGFGRPIVFLENFHRLFDVGDLENTGGSAAFGACGAIGVGYVDMVGGKLFGDYGKSARFVVEVDAEDFGFVNREIGLAEEFFGYLGFIKDDPQHAVLYRVHHRHSDDINFGFG